jgi:NADH-quinone oxidoreductase subunit H
MAILLPIIYLLVFPGFLFQSAFSTFLEWVDRKLYARMQNRRGPMYTGNAGLLQPIADIIKLMAKEDLVPAAADKLMFGITPLIALASVLTAGLFIPFMNIGPGASFRGDLVVVLYLLSLPSLMLFLSGWFSVSPYALLGATRVLTQVFAYEVPFFIALLTPAMVTGEWQISKIASFPWWHGPMWSIVLRGLAQLIGFTIGVIALQAKLERVPFDIPEAETEVVAGPLTEYSGKKLAVYRFQKDILMWVGAALLGVLFLPNVPMSQDPSALRIVANVVLICAKATFVVCLLAGMKAAFARIRIDQIVNFSWKYLAPASLAQFFIALLLKAYGVV